MSFQCVSVQVDNPQKHLDPLETYISFRITTKVKQDVSEEEFVVRRRYNDFLWLRNKLIESYPTYIVPSLPGKHSVLGQLDRYSRQFIMCRMAMLDSYLQRLAAHPVFSSSSPLNVFLTAKPAEFLVQTKAGLGLLDKLSGSFHNLTGYLPKNVQVHSQFDSTKKYVTHLSTKLSTILEISSRIYKERMYLKTGLEEAKKSVCVWSGFEPNLAPYLRILEDTISQIIELQNVHLIQTYTKSIHHPVEEYLTFIEAVNETLARRDSIQLACEAAVEETSRKKVEQEQLLAVDSTSNGFGLRLWKPNNKDRLKKLQHEIPNLDKLAEENLDRMEVANEGLRADLERWNTEKRTEIKTMLNQFTDLHIKYYQQSLLVWEKALVDYQHTKSFKQSTLT